MQSQPESNICLLCCQQNEIFIIPKCNHKQVCWKCCMKLNKAGRFECPFCKQGHHQKQKIIFVNQQQMSLYKYADLLQIKKSPIQLLKSQKNSNFYYSSIQIAQKIQYQTSYTCPLCQQSDNLFKSLNQLKKHLDQKHSRQYCDICLLNRKCIQSQQILYNDNQYQRHLTSGEFTQNGDLILYHPKCQFCRQHFYDIDQFKRHLEKQHEKCYHCHKNSEEFKYVYFRNYQQAVEHFKKSHFYCEIGNCLNTKFQNVFVTEEALNDHILRQHKKAKKSNQPVMNMLLGFNKNQAQQIFQWDKVGKNYKQIFQMVQKHANVAKLQPVEHEDSFIDIRDFYPQQSKRTINLSLHRIKQMLFDKIQDIGWNRDIYVTDVEFFKPLQMSPLSRVQLQKFINAVFQPKIAGPIITNFFQGRQDFNSAEQYFTFVRSKMQAYHKLAYYYAFPQLVRFFKNQNPHKIPMQEFYYQSLRELKFFKNFIVHSKPKYSQTIQFMKKTIQKQMQERFNDTISQKSSLSKQKQLDLQKYQIFLKDLNSSFYIDNQQSIFYVSKDKMTNLYHMIHRCKIKDFLKMNWLLKIGFNNQAYKIIQKNFYYKEESQCQNAMKKLTIQQLGYLYAYCTVCLQAIFQKFIFKQNKQKSVPFFLSSVMVNFPNKNRNTIKFQNYHKALKNLIQKQNKSLNLQYHVKENKNKGIIANQKEYQSLLNYGLHNNDKDKNKIRKIQTSKKDSDFPELVSFGTQRPRVWNQTSSSIVQQKKSVIQLQDYPSILSTKKQDKKQQKKKDQQDFPVYHFVGKKNKNKINTSVNVNELQNVIGWSNKGFVPNQWNQQKSKKTWDQRLQDQQRRIKKQKQFQKQRKQKEQINSKDKIVDNILINKKNPDIIQQKKQKVQPVKNDSQPMIISKGKKSNIIDEEFTFPQTKEKTKKNKNKTMKQQKQQSESDEGIFGKIQKQANLLTKKIKINQIQQINQSKTNTKQKDKSIQQLKNNYLDQQAIFVPQNGQFPSLGSSKPVPKQQIKIEKPQTIFPPKKKKKMRLDDTSSQQQKKQHKKSQQFVSISDQFKKQSNNNKISKVNEIIQSAKVQEQPQNQIKVKKGKNGKKQIIQRVNFFAL